jgi:hypothetical protein
MNAARVFPEVGGLIAPTIPALQWGEGRSCLQKNQMGCVALVMVMLKVGGATPLSEFASGMRTQPESKPPAMGLQGSLKVDCVTEWFPGAPTNWKVTTLPLVAVILFGMNWKMPPGVFISAPTWIVI